MTPQQRKQQFINRGESVREWAVSNGLKDKDLTAVYRVLNGQSPARRGKHHLIAVKLGLKPDPEKLTA
jgi:gp16 family phage-associated protein